MNDDLVRESYDAIAELYASLFLSDLDRNTYAQDWLATFARLAGAHAGIVADVGCGPGHVTHHLTELGLTVVGSDISPGQIAQARLAFPDLSFTVGDLGALDCADSALGGINSRYSLIHMVPARFPEVFNEWKRALEPGAPVLVTFFGSLSAQTHGTPFDHKAVTAYELFPATIAKEFQDAGFTNIEIDTRRPPKDGRPFSQGTVLARKSNA